jgi:protein-tyrosine phosphatase
MYYDLHSHILPGVDDGSDSPETSLAMLRYAGERNTTGIVATPHLLDTSELSWKTICEACRELEESARQAGVAVAIYPGAEVAFYSGIEKMVQGPGEFCINHSRYMLLELPANQVPFSVHDLIFTLQARGIILVLAHPERNVELMSQPELVLDWAEKGVLFQINGSSLNGRMGTPAMEAAERMLLSNLVCCIASDGHGITSRRPGLEQAAQKVSDLVGTEKMEQLFSANPCRIIQNQDIPLNSIDEKYFLRIKQSGRKWFGLFG